MFLIPHVGTIIWTTIIFLLLVYILGKFAWKPLLKALAEREQNIERALTGAAEANEKIKSLQAEQEEIIKATRLEKEQLLKEGVLQRNTIISDAKIKAQEEADKIIENTRKQLAFERAKALEDLRNQVAELSLEIAGKVVSAEMSDKIRHEKLVKELVDDIELN
ncbi:MAG TPA: F0F1 ATP synthase subunit B [Prolixibacteraceae bacterium]|nr:F0F1 ATP synthase subunit B [Prolixibacteraceae bacterium]